MRTNCIATKLLHWVMNISALFFWSGGHKLIQVNTQNVRYSFIKWVCVCVRTVHRYLTLVLGDEHFSIIFLGVEGAQINPSKHTKYPLIIY